MDIKNPVNAAVINGKMKSSEVRSGFLISNSITTKKELVANVVDEYSSVTFEGRFSNLNGGLESEKQSQIKCTAIYVKQIKK